MNTCSPKLTLVALAFASGTLLGGCRVTRPNPEHCFHAAGDETCAERDPALPFCATPTCDDAAYGCVAEPPEPDCYSPCGGSATAELDDSCIEVAGDGDGDTGDGDGGLDLPPECGDGEVGPDEECDDANTIDEDECTNACTLPICGDGIVQVGNDEQCDDANTDANDGCTACVLPGALIWELVLDLGTQTFDVGLRVVLDSGEHIAIVLISEGNYRLTEYDADGNPLWSYAALTTVNPSLAVGPDDVLVIGGKAGMQGSTKLYDTDGTLQWTRTVPTPDSGIHDVAIDGMGYVLSAGYAGSGAGLLFRHDAAGTEDWSYSTPVATGFGPIAVTPEGHIWAVRTTPHRLDHFDETATPVGFPQVLPDSIEDELTLDTEGNVYLLSSTMTAFTLSKYSDSASLLWSVDHEGPTESETAHGLALLPGGGVVVAGTSHGELPSESDGLLAWYDANGEALAPDTIVDGDTATDADVFFDVAVSPNGYAVAVGMHQPGDLDADLWIRKFEL